MVQIMPKKTPASGKDRLLLLVILSSPLFAGLAVVYGLLLWEKFDPEPDRKRKLRSRIADEYRQRGARLSASSSNVVAAENCNHQLGRMEINVCFVIQFLTAPLGDLSSLVS